MTPDHLARIAAAIDADAATEASNWPLARDRTRAYLALARAVGDYLDDQSGIFGSPPLALVAAYAALAPDTEEETA